MGYIIGRGERATLQILKKIFPPNSKFFIQYPLKKLLSKKYIEDISSRQDKETIDIVIMDGTDKMAIRVQDERHRTHTYLSRMDENQRRLLEWSGVRVVDINEINCPTLFKDVVNSDSEEEIRKELGI